MITFRLSVHPLDNTDVVEIFSDGEFIAAIYAGTGLGSERDHRAIRIISKFHQTIEQDEVMPMITKLTFGR